jgi:hypothetical protein
MSESIKQLTAEELQSIKDLQQQYNKFVFELGSIESQIIAFQKQIKILEEDKRKSSSGIDDISEKERLLVDSLQAKYGAGNIDIETGAISSL